MEERRDHPPRERGAPRPKPAPDEPAERPVPARSGTPADERERLDLRLDTLRQENDESGGH